jgi:molecular chaperone GrpE
MEEKQPDQTIQPHDAPKTEAIPQESTPLIDPALVKALEKITELEGNYLRAKAAHKFAIERFAEHLLPVLDSFEAALTDSSSDIAKVREGIELTLRQFNHALEKGRVVAINPALGEKFDPHLHQAISMVSAEQEPNSVVTVLQKGYLIAERVLRPALVTVCELKNSTPTPVPHAGLA